MIFTKTNSYDEIYNVMYSCRNDFFNQNLNNENEISKLAHKFSSFSSFVIAYEGDNDSPMGFVAYYNNDLHTRSGFISMIIILKQHQGKGVGTGMLEYALNDCRKEGMLSISLDVSKENIKAQKFYFKMGFCVEKVISGNTIRLRKKV